MKLTKAVIDGLEPGHKRYKVLDDEIPAYGIRVSPDGEKVFFLDVRIRGRKTLLTLGHHGEITAHQARERARQWKDLARQGKDPRQEKRDGKEAVTFDKLAERFLEEHVEVYLKPRTRDVYRQQVEGILVPYFKKGLVREIDPDLVSRFHIWARGKGMNRRANHALAILSKMMNLAEVWYPKDRPLGTNPCQHQKRYREAKRQRYLTEAELVRLGVALKAAEGTWSTFALAAIRVLLLTGARKTEIRTLAWHQVDLKAGVARLDDHKTAGASGAKTLQLGPPVVDLLRKLAHQEDCPFVFPAARGNGPVGNLDQPWRAVRKAAGLEDVHLHDLRHTFGATGAGLGQSLRTIGAILGHTSQATTQRYAHVAESPAKEAATATSRVLAKAMRKQAPRPGKP